MPQHGDTVTLIANHASHEREGEMIMSSYNGPTGKATLWAKSERGSTRVYEGEITFSNDLLIVIVQTEHTMVDGEYWYGEVEYTIPWKQVLFVEQPVKKLS